MILVIVITVAILLPMLAWNAPVALVKMLALLGSETPEAQAAEFGRLVLVVLGFALAVFVLWKLPKVQAASAQGLSRKDRAQFENTARATLAQIVGGTVVIVGILFTWGNLQVAQQNTEVARRNSEIARAGQITERFTKAVEQLGSGGLQDPDVEIRVGGIYALERIARDSGGTADDHTAIVLEVLQAYIRENTNADSPSSCETERSAGGTHRSMARSDVDTAQKVFRRLTSRARLNEIDLQGIILRQADLSGVNLYSARLRDADLTEANLANLDLREAVLVNADLTGARLTGAYLDRADLRGARLIGACLNGASVTAPLIGAKLNGADLRRANLTEADLYRADLSEADLQEANLERANLRGADLSGANLRTASGLTQEQLDSAVVDREDPQLPGGLRPPRRSNAPIALPST